MHADGIFLETDGALSVMKQQNYDSESVLQLALEKFPEVIAGSMTASDDEAQLLLIRREMGVPGTEGGGATWSLDHLFVDSDGTPVLVEVKRSSDRRIRREVVGQMLDYAANAVRYWPVEQLQEALEKTAGESGKTADELITGLRPDWEPEDFWKTVEANLREGKVRLLFVADALPDPLVRIIEFLNEQMRPAEVLGVELRLYVGGAEKAYVPRVIGRTSEAKIAKTIVTGQQWTRDTFLDAAKSRCSPGEVAIMERLLSHVDKVGSRLSWGKGVTPGVAGWYAIEGQPRPVWNLNANSEAANTRAYLYFYLSEVLPVAGVERVNRAAAILETIPGFAPKVAEAREAEWRKYPSMYLPDIAHDESIVEKILAAVDVLTATEEAGSGAGNV